MKAVATVSPRSVVIDATQAMKRQDIGAVVVVSDDGKPIGVLTDRDVALRVVAEGRDPSRTPVEEVMTRGAAYLSHEASIEDASEIMRDCGVRRLPLVDASGRVDGLVSFDDLVLLLGMEMGNLASAIFMGMSARARANMQPESP